MSGQHIAVLLKNLRELQSLSNIVDQHLDIQRVVRQTVPRTLSDITCVASLTAGTLTLLTNNGSTAAKIKQLTPRMVAALGQQGHQVNGIDVRVQALAFANPLSKKDNLMTPEGRAAIGLLVKRLSESPLRTALERLAQRNSGLG